MWDLHNTSCTLSACTMPLPPPSPATTSISFDDHRSYVHPMNVPSTSSPCEDDVSISTSSSSFTDALAHHPALTSGPSARPPLKTAASPSETMVGGYSGSTNLHLWSHFLLSDSTCEDEYRPDICENLLDAVPAKSESLGGVFECDYLKKLDNSYWDNPHYFNSIRSSSFIDGCERPSGEWSFAALHESSHAISSGVAPIGMVVGKDSIDQCVCNGHGNPSCHEKNASTVGLRQIGNKVTACGGSARSLADLISFGSRIIAKPSPDVKALRQPSPTPDVKKRVLKHTSPKGDHSVREHGSGTASEGSKRKRCELDRSSEKLHKKHKHENSTAASSTKVPVPKVKLGDRIATLQQIVSPFGKTDTASVLMEAIAYIKFLQEQVELLTRNPYLKTHPPREYPWGGMGREEAKLDLKSRGLCLVPLSWTPQVCRESTGSDYWAPPYRGIFYSNTTLCENSSETCKT